jgi:rhamnogalacturonan endolyase
MILVLILLAVAATFGELKAAEVKPVPDRVVVLTFDDAVRSHAMFVAPLLQKHGFGATFFVCEFPPDFNTAKEKYMTWEQIRSLHEMGFEVGSHTRTHTHVDRMSQEKFVEELRYIEERCQKEGIPAPKTFAYPAYVTTPAAVKTLHERGYLFARGGGSRAYDAAKDDPLLIPSFSTSGTNSARVLEALRQARDGKVVVLTVHGVPDTAHPNVTTAPELFEQYLKFLKDEHYTVIGLGDLAKYVGPREVTKSASAAIRPRQMENLGRGVVAIRQGDGKVYIGWRLLGTDPEAIAFNVYRSANGKEATKLNAEPVTRSTDFVDGNADVRQKNKYFVRAVLNGQEGEGSGAFELPTNAASYLSIPLRTPEGYTPNDGSVGDLDGDGEYEIVLHQASRGRDNSQGGRTGEPILEAYKVDGSFLWRINLGKNIREGAHYTQFMVYDLDGDGKAELVCKTADGTIDGQGNVIGDAKADYRNANGYVLDGPEFLTVFEGATGKALATTNYIPARGSAHDWGDDYGNRVDRFLACVAYLDGVRPSVVMCRGYYTRTVLAAWNWRGGKLTNVWTFDSDDGTPGNRAYRGQGDHSVTVGDIDGDGRDEIIYGACAIDDNGKGLYSTGLGHGDALHLSDIDPDRAGLEVFNIHERPQHPNGAEFRDARTGRLIWGKPGGTEPAPDVGRGVAMDIDPRHHGYEMWASGEGLRGIWNVKGEQISGEKPRSCNFGVWWDGDFLRELLDRNVIWKWNWESGTETRLLVAEDCSANNGTKSTPVLCADILGDWREEVIWRTRDNNELRIYTTTIPSQHRLYALMHDPQYRLSVAWQNVGYNQPTQPGFYLGEGMAKAPRPNITTTQISAPLDGRK